MATTIVSPIARDMPRMNAATMPEMPAGTTTRKLVWWRCAPSPKAASRSAIGTARSESSATEAMIGMVRIPTPMPAASRVNARLAPLNRLTTSSGLMKAIAK